MKNMTKLLLLICFPWVAASALATTSHSPAATKPDHPTSKKEQVSGKTTDKKEDTAPEPHYYQWTDARGNLHFSDKPPSGTNKKVKKHQLTPAPETGTSDSTRIYQRANNILTQPAPGDRSTIFSNDNGKTGDKPKRKNPVHQPDNSQVH